jgi:hypothetical protein
LQHVDAASSHLHPPADGSTPLLAGAINAVAPPKENIKASSRRFGQEDVLAVYRTMWEEDVNRARALLLAELGLSKDLDLRPLEVNAT